MFVDIANRRVALVFCGAAILSASCSSPNAIIEARPEQVASAPEPAPSLTPFSPPEERRWRAEHPLARIGAQLFFDPRLSADGSTSCGACHQPERGFSSDRQVNGRDATALVNLGFAQRFGERAALERRVRFVLERHVGQTQDVSSVVSRLRGDSSYHELMAAVVPGGLNEDSLIAALTEFVARLISSDSALDAFLAGETAALTMAARRGLELFRGPAGCIACHNGPMLSDGKHHRACVDGRTRERFRRTPSLRDITDTGPYLRDGSVPDLIELLRRHSASCEAEAMALSGEQVSDLRVFLDSLSGVRVAYYPIRLPSRKRVAGELHEEMDRIDVLMNKNLAAIQAAVRGLSEPRISARVWADIVSASGRIKWISGRLRYLFPPQHLHDLDAYYRFVRELGTSADALALAAQEGVFDDAYTALSDLNRTCNACHALYRPVANGVVSP